jgi:hypothetical protein
MSRIFYAVAVIAGLTASGNALAQATTAPNNGADNSVNPQSRSVLGATLSGSGNVGTNANSSTINTGTTNHDHAGMGASNNEAGDTEAPATTKHRTIGANTNSSPDMNQ